MGLVLLWLGRGFGFVCEMFETEFQIEQGRIPEVTGLPEFDDMATGGKFLEDVGQSSGEMIKDLADALVASADPYQAWTGGIESGKIGKVLILADDDPAAGASKAPDLAIRSLGKIEGSKMLALHTVGQEKRGQAGGELVVEQKSQATRTTELPAWAAA